MSREASFIVIKQQCPITLAPNFTPVTCNGLSNGSASVTVGGGSGSYSYAWSIGGQTGVTATGLAAATYTVTVTDNTGGCTSTTSITVTQPSTLTLGVSSVNVTCKGKNNGSATGIPVGGTVPYTYAWSNTTQTGVVASSLSPQTYTLTVTDLKGCTVTSFVTITEPPLLTATTSSTSVLCFGTSTGKATVVAGGGNNTYTYLWNSTPNQTTSNATGLSAGSYTVTVTDAKGCTATSTTTVTQPPALTASLTKTNVLCFGGSTGTATATPNGGTTAYAFTWNTTPVQHTAVATGLSNQSYTVTVRDANACTYSTTVTITEPPLLQTTINPTNSTCYNYNDGKATTSPTGGTPLYTYKWSIAAQTIGAVSNLAIGTYTVTITDANNCTTTSTTTITEPPAPVKNTTVKNIACFGDNDGKAWVTPNGSKSPYLYAWTPNLSLNDTIFSLKAGTYSVTVTDAVGCKQSTSVIIVNPPLLTGTIVGTNSSCNGKKDGTITITPLGGTAPYNYSWNTVPSQTTAAATNLGSGTYTIKLSDSKGCEFYTTSTISEAPPIFINAPIITNETCQLTNGKIEISVLGGNIPYTYVWSGSASGQNTAKVINLLSGTYTVTVTDNKGCSTTKSATVLTQFSPPAIFASSVNNISCFGAKDGKIGVTPSAGAPTYAFKWLPGGGTGLTASNLSAATYTVTVTDANGCTATTFATITEPALLALNSSSTNVSCGSTDGTASVNPSGGKAPYSISWANGATTATISNLSAGTYAVTVTDANNCSASKVITVGNVAPMNLTPSSTNITCNGANNGKAGVQATGSSGTFKYNWAPSGGTASTATNLSANTYTVTVTDALNLLCSSTITIVITEPSALLAPVNVVGIGCSGNNTGQVSVVPTGGSSPYVYLWSNAKTSSSISGLTAGDYSVTVTDAKGCTIKTNGTVSQGVAINLGVTSTNNKCFGQSAGEAVVTANGGVTPYTYSWSPSGGTATTASNLAANSYTVKVTDGNGCSSTSVVVITEPPKLTLSATKTNATCGTNNGTATITTGGGVTPYAYAWSNSGTGAIESNLSPATYTVTVSDANTCSKTTTVTISISQLLTVTLTKTNVTCNGASNGIITTTVTGGGGAYNYTWSPGASVTSSINTIPPGTYTVTVTDVGSPACPVIKTTTITEPAPLLINSTPTNITCNGNNNGKITTSPTGGTTPYTFNWSNGGVSSSITGLAPASYTLTLSDSKGCSKTVVETITQGSALNITIDAQTDVTCFGLSNGSATITASGGTGALTYKWLPSGGASSSASGLPAKTYTVSINDVSGCSSTVTISITQPTAALTVGTTSTNASCGGSNGTGTATPAGGTSPFTYKWSSAGTNALESGLSTGTYTVTVSDLNGCTKSATVVIADGNPLTLITNKSDVTCTGLADGMATVNVTGGSGNYSYSWSPGGATTQTVNNLIAGNYTVAVVDATNPACTKTAIVIVNQPNPLTAGIVSTNIICFGQTNGTATVSPTGGTPGYSIVWSPVVGTDTLLADLPVGSYTVTVSDANACTVTKSVTVTEPPILTLALDSVNATCIGAYDGKINSTVGGGVPGYSYNWAPTGAATDSIKGLGLGTYTLTVTDAVGCTIVKSISVTEPPPFRITTGGKDPSCYLNDGLAWVTVTEGSSVYLFSWTPTGSNNDTITGLSPGSYQVQVKDSVSGCDTIGTVTLNYPIVSIGLDSVNVTCNNFNDASVWVNASGANAPYTYTWKNSVSTNDTLTGLAPGMYVVSVTDNGGCLTIDSIRVTEPPALSFTRTSTDVTCFSGNNGTASIAASGGILPYTYSWSSGQTTSAITGISKGTYIIQLSDSNNCSLIDSIIITQATMFDVSLVADSVSCNGATDGKVKAFALGGTGLYTYAWSNGPSLADSITAVSAGKYTITVLDEKGCQALDTVDVLEPTALTLTMNVVDAQCGQDNGLVSVTALGGNGNYTYQWASIPGTNDTLSGLAVGSYSVTVTDFKGCSKIDSVAVVQSDTISISVLSTNTTCNGLNDGTAAVTANGGSGTFIYLWNPGGLATASISGLSPGTYTVSVTDQANTFCTLIDSVIISEPTILASSITSTNVQCFGTSTGTATVTATGGITPYTFMWSTAETLDSISNLAASSYTVTVSDANACTTSSSVTITEPLLLKAIVDSLNITCKGYNNGMAIAAGNGGTAPYNYTWSLAGNSNDTISNLVSGSYTVTISDSLGCVATNSISVSEPSGTALVMSKTNTACSSNIGTASVLASGGSNPYVYLWSNGNTTSNISNLYKGTYFVTVTDAKGCTIKDSVKVTEPNGIVLTFTKTNVTCNGSNDGVVSINASGGTGTYSYSWIPSGITTATRNALAPGTYAVKVTDATNTICSVIDSVTITQPTLVFPTVTATNVKCFGGNTGAASVTTVGGTAPYTYLWSASAADTTSVADLIEGTYSVTVTDKNGCTSTSSISITQPAAIATVASIKKAYCGQANGEVYVSSTGGTGNYSYSWTPVYSATDTLSGLLPGKYIVYVTDSLGCVKKDSATIILDNGISTTLTAKNVTCFGADNGEVKVSANGGSGSFIYQWMPGNNSNQNIYDLAPGMYTVTVADINITGCIKIDSILITEPPVLDVTLAISKSTCGSSNDYVAVANPTGGTPNYTYNWSFGGTNKTESNLSTGTYIIAVTDSNGCDTAKIFTISSLSTPIILPPVKNNPKCNMANGSISVSIFGGAAPFTYYWSHSTADTTANPINLIAGTYTVTVKDAFGCTDVRTAELINTALPPSVTTNSTPAVCFGSSTGIATSVAIAGSPPYFYSWSPVGGTSSTSDGVPAGVYTMTLTDAQACVATSVTTITEPLDITILFDPASLSCFGNSNGTAVATVGGGTPGYSYTWSSGGTDLIETSLSAGMYTFKVTDANACEKIDSVQVIQPPVLKIKMQIDKNVSCYGENNGKISVSITGGSPSYTYSWTPAVAADSIATSLPPGSYSVHVIDSLGCSTIDSVIITQPQPFAATAINKNITCFGQNDGQAKVIASGATAPFIYSWSPITGFTDSVSNLGPITYTLTVIDSLGCTYSYIDSIKEPSPLVIAVTSTTAHCDKKDGSASVIASGATPPYNYLWSVTGSTNSTVDSLLTGIYSVIVTDNNACTSSSTVTIGNIQGPDVSISSFNNTTCSGVCAGLARSQTIGGTGLYSYSWSTNPPQQDSIAVNMCEGNYFVAVTDSAGCIDTAHVTITAPTVVIVIAVGDTDLCIGQTSHLNATATGGQPAYEFTWDGGTFVGADYDVSPTTTTVYTVVATDSNGCPSNSETISVHVKPPLDITSLISPPPFCEGTSTKLSVKATGGNDTYSYIWIPGNFTGTDTVVTPDSTTTYKVIANDGCGTPADTVDITVIVNPLPILDFSTVDTSGCVNTCTEFTNKSSAALGDSIVSWQWSFGDASTSNKIDPVHCYKNVGQYNVKLSVRTAKGCSKTVEKPAFLSVYGLPISDFYINPDSVSSNEPFVTLSDNATDAVAWQWSFGDGDFQDEFNYSKNPTHTYKDTGRYCVEQIVTNIYGCMDTSMRCLRVYPQFTFYIPNAFSPNGDGINDGFNGKGTFIKDYKMMVFDRWGNMIFETHSLTLDWDGRANAGEKIAQQDVYVWKVELTDIFDRGHNFMGHVTLVK